VFLRTFNALRTASIHRGMDSTKCQMFHGDACQCYHQILPTVVSSWLEVLWVVDHSLYTRETIEREKRISIATLDTNRCTRHPLPQGSRTFSLRPPFQHWGTFCATPVCVPHLFLWAQAWFMTHPSGWRRENVAGLKPISSNSTHFGMGCREHSTFCNI
jgi:hypothetical protein